MTNRPFLALCFGLVALTGCASVPHVAPVAPPPGAVAPQFVGARGPLTAAQSKAVLQRINTDPAEDTGPLQRHLAIEQAVAPTPLLASNRTKILRDGPETFRAMFAAIQGAKQSINLEYFIFEDVDSDGVSLGDLLVAKQQAGVAVNVIYDSYGSSSTPAAFFDRLKQAGVNLVSFNPVNPLESKVSYSLNDRDHRKILVADGKIAIVGGVNLSTAYQSNPFGKSGAPKGAASEHWRDTDLEIEGPAVGELQALFLDHWSKQKGPPLDETGMLPAIPAAGTAVTRVLGSTPDDAVPQYYVSLLSAIRNAEKSILVSAAYFVPTDQEMEDLTGAAQRGVDVRLLVPDKSDSDLSIEVGHSHYTALLEAGVKIYETHDLVLHSKTVVIDGVWSVIGSSNFDHRSVIFNDEVDVVVLGSETTDQLEAMFQDDQNAARPIDIRTWKARSLPERLKEVFATVWESWL
ncbi:MAG TPA: phospholipase D-like domain-containing protein [Rhizomicrobium sp.]|nr:phospholipase D-like domain-containing protein [Rhizomicrobium sp.]